MVEIVSINDIKENEYEVELATDKFDDNTLAELINEICTEYNITCRRLLVTVEGIDDRFENFEYFITTILKIEPLAFNDLFGSWFTKDDTYIYDNGNILKHKTPCSTNHLECVLFTFDEVNYYGLKQLSLKYISSNKGYKILKYEGIEDGMIKFEISTRPSNSLLDFICYDNKIINTNLYKWFSENNYKTMIDLHNKAIDCLESICKSYSGTPQELSNNILYNVAKDFGVLDIYHLIIDGYPYNFRYNSNNDIDIDNNLFDDISMFQSIIINHNKYTNLYTISSVF